MGRTCAAVAIVVFVLAGCGKKNAADRVTYVDGDDPKMNAAIEEARLSVNTFIDALKSPEMGQAAFSLKVPFVEEDEVEHMWLSPITYDGTVFKGVVDNQPQVVKNVKIGQQVDVEPAKISDWMFIDNGKLIGGYTIRVMRNTLPADEQTEFDKSLPFKLE